MTTSAIEEQLVRDDSYTLPEVETKIRRVVGIGAGGHARVVLDILRTYSNVRVIGLVDADLARHGGSAGDIPILGDDLRLPSLRDEGVSHAFVGVGATRSLALRRSLFETAASLGFTMITAVHPRAYVAPGATVGRGVTIMPGAVINIGAVIGDNVIVNTGAIVEHDCRIGSHTHVATGAILAGAVEIGEESLIGAGSTVRQCSTIGDRCIVGAGAVVVRDVASGTIVAGVPARLLSTNTDKGKTERGD